MKNFRFYRGNLSQKKCEGIMAMGMSCVPFNAMGFYSYKIVKQDALCIKVSDNMFIDVDEIKTLDDVKMINDKLCKDKIELDNSVILIDDEEFDRNPHIVGDINFVCAPKLVENPVLSEDKKELIKKLVVPKRNS